MLPVNSNTTSPCVNVSSNCVIWQGPDIPCINLCHGDSISQVVAKLAEQLCDLTDQIVSVEPSLEGLNLLCVLPQGQTAPTTIAGVIQLIIDYICNLQPSSNYTLPIMNLPPCLHYDDPTTGVLVTTARLDHFATLIANKLCDINDTVILHGQLLGSIEGRLTILENCVLPCAASSPLEVQVISNCLLSNSGLVNLSTLVLEIESQFCTLQSAVGTPALISYAINSSNCISGSSQMLSAPANYGSQPTWLPTNAASLAQMVNNLYVVACDMYQAIQTIQQNCCPSGCDSVQFGYLTSVLNDANGFPQNIRVVFTPCVIPTQFSDCNAGTTIRIEDSLGNSVSSTVNAANLQNSTTGVLVNVSSLNVFADLNVRVSFCVTDGQNTCSENINSVIPLTIPCPDDVNFVMDEGAQGVTVTFNNILGLLASYTVNLYNSSNILVDQSVHNTSSDPISVKFNDLEVNTDYYIIIQVTVNGNTVSCDSIPFNTGLVTTSCASGVDLAILLDYTESMGAIINELKAGANNLATTVESFSVTVPYRMGLMLVDEVLDNTSVNYEASTEWAAIPNANKLVIQGSTTDIYLTGLVPLVDNNKVDFETKVAYLNDPAQIALGSGVNAPDPLDIGMDNLLVGSSSVINSFRPSVRKYLVIITDTVPSGLDDAYTSLDNLSIQNFTTQCINEGIRVIVLGSGATAQVWQNIATATGGAYESTFDENTLAIKIQDICNSLEA